MSSVEPGKKPEKRGILHAGNFRFQRIFPNFQPVKIARTRSGEMRKCLTQSPQSPRSFLGGNTSWKPVTRNATRSAVRASWDCVYPLARKCCVTSNWYTAARIPTPKTCRIGTRERSGEMRECLTQSPQSPQSPRSFLGGNASWKPVTRNATRSAVRASWDCVYPLARRAYGTSNADWCFP